MTLQDLLLGVLLPAAVAGVLLLLARLPLLGRVLVPLSLGAAYVAGHLGLRGWRDWVPRESTDRVGAIVAAGAVVAVTHLGRAGPLPLRLAMRLALGAGAAFYLCGDTYVRSFGWPGALVQLGLAGLATTLLWTLAARRHESGPPLGDEARAHTVAREGAREELLLAAAAGAAAVAVGLSGTQLHAQLFGVLAAALGGAAVAGRWLRAAPLLPGAAPALALAWMTLLLAPSAFADLPRASAGLLALAPLAAPGAGRSGFLPRLVVVLVLAGAAVWFAYDASPSFEGL